MSGPAPTHPCGTVAAYARHLAHGERPCEPCRIANRDRVRKARGWSPRTLKPCGTYAAYLRHYRNGEKPCASCKKAMKEYTQARYTPRQRKVKPCGTHAAFQRHKARGEEPCGPCREAYNAYMSDIDHRRRAQKLSTASGQVDRRVVFARDRWVCQLCAQPVDPEASYPHPEAPTLDHITPLSRGGTHTYDNVQLAHARCNWSKGARASVVAAVVQ